MPRQNDAWDHWYNDLVVSTSKLQRQVKCKFCPLTRAYRANRMLAHLDYRSPQGGVRDVSICKMVPHPTKQMFENCGGMVPTLPNATLESVNNVCTEEEVEELEPVLFQCGITAGIAHREPLQSSESTIPSLREVDETPMRELSQRSLSKGFNTSTKEILDKVWVSAFYKANISFNVVTHSTFIHAVQETARLQMPTYRPPSYNAVRIEKVGVYNVVQVCMDNASVMNAASCHILQSTSHLYVQGCTAHCLDLLLEDWSKEEWMK